MRPQADLEPPSRLDGEGRLTGTTPVGGEVKPTSRNQREFRVTNTHWTDEYQTYAPSNSKCARCGYPIETLEPALRTVEGGSEAGLRVLYRHSNRAGCLKAKRRRALGNDGR